MGTVHNARLLLHNAQLATTPLTVIYTLNCTRLRLFPSHLKKNYRKIVLKYLQTCRVRSTYKFSQWSYELNRYVLNLWKQKILYAWTHIVLTQHAFMVLADVLEISSGTRYLCGSCGDRNDWKSMAAVIAPQYDNL